MSEDKQEKLLPQQLEPGSMSIATDTKNALREIPDYDVQEDMTEAEMWAIYEELEPRLRGVNRMLADS